MYGLNLFKVWKIYGHFCPFGSHNLLGIMVVFGSIWVSRWLSDEESTMQEMWVWPLGQEDPLEEEIVTHSNILDWRTPWTEEPGRLYSPWGHKESDTTEYTHMVELNMLILKI